MNKSSSRNRRYKALRECLAILAGAAFFVLLAATAGIPGKAPSIKPVAADQALHPRFLPADALGPSAP